MLYQIRISTLINNMHMITIFEFTDVYEDSYNNIIFIYTLV